MAEVNERSSFTLARTAPMAYTMPAIRKFAIFSVLAIISVGVALAFIWVAGDSYNRATAEGDLRAAGTAADEFVAFDRMARRGPRMHFALYDANGEMLGMSTSDWLNRASVIRFYQFGEPPLDHTIVDRKNISTLVRE